MYNIDELIQAWEQLDRATLVERAKEAVHNLTRMCQAMDPEDDRQVLQDIFILMAAIADGDLCESDQRMLAEAADFKLDSLPELIPLFEEKEAKFQSNPDLPIDADFVSNLIMLTLAFSAATGKINDNARAFISDYMETA